MSSISNRPTIFSKNDKFDGTNQIFFKTIVIITAKVQGAMRYLDSNIIDLLTIVKLSFRSEMTTSTSIPPLQTDIPSYSNYPSTGEQKIRNTQAKGLLLYNIQNLVGSGANIAGTVGELWKSLTNLYDKTSELALLHAKKQLRNLCF